MISTILHWVEIGAGLGIGLFLAALVILLFCALSTQ